MDFLRMYLGEIVSLVLAILIFFAAATIASRNGVNPRLVRNVRNVCIALTVAAVAASWTYSLIVNRAPRGTIDRSGVDQDQKVFETRYSEQKK